MVCSSFFLSSFFPRLISAVVDWMSTILSHMVWPYAGLKRAACGSLEMQDPKNSQKSCHLGTIAQLCRAISSQLRHLSTIGKNVLSSDMSSTCPHNIRPTNGWDPLASFGHLCKFQRVSRLGIVTARHLVVGVSQTLRCWTEGATYVRQGDHHVGHWPTFLVEITFDLFDFLV